MLEDRSHAEATRSTCARRPGRRASGALAVLVLAACAGAPSGTEPDRIDLRVANDYPVPIALSLLWEGSAAPSRLGDLAPGETRAWAVRPLRGELRILVESQAERRTTTSNHVLITADNADATLLLVIDAMFRATLEDPGARLRR